jgi:hypothetical protein
VAHATDLDLTPRAVVELASPDDVAAFLAKLGYDTADRAPLTPEAVGLSGESAAAVKRIELLSEDPEHFLRVVFAQPKSLTARVRTDLVRALGKSTIDHFSLRLVHQMGASERNCHEQRRERLTGRYPGIAIRPEARSDCACSPGCPDS